MNRARVLAAVLVTIGVVLPTGAPAQNLEAGKSPGQLFNNTCTACHRSPRGLLRTIAPGSLPGFLREHYTTSREMAQQLSGFLISNGATDTRGRPQEARQQPAGAEPQRPQRPGEPEPQARPRPPEQEQQPRPQRPIEQEQAAKPPEHPQQTARPDPREQARIERREKRAKREAERTATALAEREAARRDKDRRGSISPARIDAASARGKEALPLGSVLQTLPPVESVKPDVAVPPAVETAKPAAPSAGETSTRADPVPQVTPAPPVSETPTGSSAAETSQGSSQGSDDTPAGDPTPAAAEPAPAASGPPPKPPISN